MSGTASDTVDFMVVDDMPKADVGCICDRPTSHLLCIKCKRLIFGRIFEQCQKHPCVFYMHDLKLCVCGGDLVSLPAGVKLVSK